MEQLLVGLLLWISQNTSFEYHQDMGLPIVEQVTQHELVKIYVGEDNHAQGFLSENDKETMHKNLLVSLQAVYTSDTNVIYLGGKVNPETEYGRSVLVHELVHFLQKKHNHHQNVVCMNELEKDAYLIQAQYMREKNLKPPFDKFTILIRSICENYF